MNVLASMPASGIIVIAAIAILFVLAVLLLFYTWGRYKGLAGMVKGGLDRDNGFLRFTVNDFADAYKKYGQNAVSYTHLLSGGKGPFQPNGCDVYRGVKAVLLGLLHNAIP